jgi:hypothetical protein
MLPKTVITASNPRANFGDPQSDLGWAVERIGSGLMCDELVMRLIMNFLIRPEISRESGTPAKWHRFEK